MYVSTQITGVGDTEDGLLDAGDAGKLKIIPNIFADINCFVFIYAACVMSSTNFSLR